MAIKPEGRLCLQCVTPALHFCRSARSQTMACEAFLGTELAMASLRPLGKAIHAQRSKSNTHVFSHSVTEGAAPRMVPVPRCLARGRGGKVPSLGTQGDDPRSGRGVGQEWACSSPFLYFTDHSEDLGQLITEGRRREFRHFVAFVEPEAREMIPDPQAVLTFESSRLDWSERGREPHASTLRLYQALLGLRRAEAALRSNRPKDFEAVALDEDTLYLRRDSGEGAQVHVLVRLRGSGTVSLEGRNEPGPATGRSWYCLLTTEEPPFSTDPSPPRIELGDRAPVVEFPRPAAVVLKSTPHGPGTVG